MDSKFANSVIRFLYKADKPVIKSSLSKVVNNPYTLSKLLESLSKEGLVDYSINEFGRKSYRISLTPKGRLVAEQLMKAEQIANSPTVEIKDVHELDLTMTDEEAEMAKHLNLLFHINVMDDHITVEEVKLGKPSRIFNIYVKRNGNDEFRLWCEHDNSYDWWHVKAARIFTSLICILVIPFRIFGHLARGCSGSMCSLRATLFSSIPENLLPQTLCEQAYETGAL